MTAQAVITAYDGAATPVVHSLVDAGVTIEDGVTTCLWEEAISTLTKEAQVRFTETKRRLKSGVLEVTAMTEVPVMESIGSQNASGYTAPPKVAHVGKIQTKMWAHPRSTEDSRGLLTQLHLNTLNNVATSVARVSAGYPMVLFQKLITPT